MAHNGVLAHPVERNTGSVEVSGSSPLYSTILYHNRYHKAGRPAKKLHREIPDKRKEYANYIRRRT